MTRYWTIFSYAGWRTLCSEHRTREAAERAARKCEARGGARHEIVRVQFLRRARP